MDLLLSFASNTLSSEGQRDTPKQIMMIMMIMANDDDEKCGE